MTRGNSTIRTLAVTLAACLLCFTLADAKKPDKPGGGGGGGISFRVIELVEPDDLDPVGRVVPRDVNDANHVVGQVEVDPNGYNALYWSLDASGATPINLGSDAIANGLNESDEIVGARLDDTSRNGVPALWLNPLAEPIDLPLPTGHHSGEASRINDDGFIVGSSVEMVPGFDQNNNPIMIPLTHAVAWRVLWNDGLPDVVTPKILGGLATGEHHWAEGVSAAEQVLDGIFAAKVVGTAHDADEYPRAVIWELISYVDSSGEIQIDVVSGPMDLGTLPDDNGSYGDAINRRGDVAGTPGFRKLDGQPLEPLLPPAHISDPGFTYIKDINDAAEVVGEHWHGTGYSNPILWLSDGSAVDLDKSLGGSGWASFHSPMAINNSRVIVGFGKKYEGKGKNRSMVNRAFLLLPE